MRKEREKQRESLTSSDLANDFKLQVWDNTDTSEHDLISFDITAHFLTWISGSGFDCYHHFFLHQTSYEVVLLIRYTERSELIQHEQGLTQIREKAHMAMTEMTQPNDNDQLTRASSNVRRIRLHKSLIPILQIQL